MTDTFFIKDNKAIFNGRGYGFTNLPENVIFDGDIDIPNKFLSKLPDMSTWVIKGCFNCSYNQLTSLSGCPKEVNNFWCYDNKLTSLKGCPKEVGGSFYCSSNRLISLEHCPWKINGDFACYDNSLTSLKHYPKEIYGNFYCMSNSIEIIDAWPEYIEGDFRFDNHKIKYIIDGVVPIKYLIDFYKRGVYHSRELLMKEFGCNAEEELNTYLLMMGKI